MKQVLALYLRCVKDVNQYVPGRIPSIVLYALVRATTPYVTIWFSAQIINELAAQRRPEVLWEWVIWSVAVGAVLGLAGVVMNRWKEATDTLHNARKNRMFMKKFLSMDYADVDDQRTRDLYAQIAQNENWMGWGINVAIENLENFVNGLIGVFGAIALTLSLFTSQVPATAGKWVVLNSPLFILALVGVMGLITWFSLFRNHVLNHEIAVMAEGATLGNRKYTYLFTFSSDAKRRLDIRTYGQERLMESFTSDTFFEPGGSYDRLTKSAIGILAYAAEAGSAVFTGVVYVFTCLKAWAGAFGVGSVTQYVGAVTTLSQNISLLLGTFDQMRNNAKFLQDTYDLLDIPNSMYQGSLTTEKRSDRQYEVEFRNVSFKYPGAENWSLKNVSMKFRVGERLAIVGENGSGKTTFIKLLCRLYDPQEGEILLNGIDIRKYNYRDYLAIFSVVFQDFQLLSQPLGANVAGSSHYDRERVRRALVDAGFGQRLDDMGLDTFLYRDFAEEGVEVSGGEAQKIAIARALYKDAPFIILDEPTAALDPIAEAEIYSKFNDIAGDKTAIYISHRLSSCKFCDEIAVFQDGSIVQQGTHEALLRDEKGQYYRFWNAQAQYYQTKD